MAYGKPALSLSELFGVIPSTLFGVLLRLSAPILQARPARLQFNATRLPGEMPETWVNFRVADYTAAHN